MATNNYALDWSDLAFTSKKSLRDLDATFIVAPRELSVERFKQIIKTYLPKGNIVLGISKEPFVGGFEEQPWFRMLELEDVQNVINQVNRASGTPKIYTLQYFQRELPYILEKIDYKKVVLINGSWRHVFHVSPAYYILSGKKTPYDMISPFVDEKEARKYEASVEDQIIDVLDSQTDFHEKYTERQMLELAAKSGTRSFDYSFQTGLSLGERISNTKYYKFLIATYNKVVPYQTYALHHGSAREKYFSPPNDLNHYDTVHAEAMLLIQAQKQQKSLANTVLFINLMPCPTCARMLSLTDIKEIVYQQDHSDGYAVKLLTEAGKTVRRVV